MNTLTNTETKKQVNREELEQKVKHMYRKVALHPEVKYHFEMGRVLAEKLGYPASTLDKVPSEAVDSFAGVGYFFDLANLQKGEKVVDLGSGSGMDVFFAALEVGDSGEVTGVDMTNEQLAKAIGLKEKYSFNQVGFRKSYIEEIPFESGSADAVISNGVINLSSEKEKVFREVARILKKGGKLVLSDIVTGIRLPENIRCNATLWAACIGGAMQKDEYFELINSAGMNLVEVKWNPYEFLSNSAKGATKDYDIESISLLAVKQ